MSAESDQHELILILARDLTSRLATPSFVVDANGTLVYFNEAAESLLGTSYAESGPLAPKEWGTQWAPADDDGTPIAPENLPLSIAFREGRPAHLAMCITVEGQERDIEVSAFPLFARSDTISGAIAVFWERHEGER